MRLTSKLELKNLSELKYKSVENIRTDVWRAKRMANAEKILGDILHMEKYLTDMKLEYGEGEETENL